MSARRTSNILSFVIFPAGSLPLFLLGAAVHWIFAALVLPFVCLMGLWGSRIRCPKCNTPVDWHKYRILGFELEWWSALTPRYCEHCSYDLEQDPRKVAAEQPTGERAGIAPGSDASVTVRRGRYALTKCPQCIQRRAGEVAVVFASAAAGLFVTWHMFRLIHDGLPLTEVWGRVAPETVVALTVMYIWARSFLHYAHEPRPRTRYVLKMFVCSVVCAAIGGALSALSTRLLMPLMW